MAGKAAPRNQGVALCPAPAQGCLGRQRSIAPRCRVRHSGLGHAPDRAELVAIRVAHIAQVHGPQRAFAQARRFFDGTAAMRDRHIVEGLDLFGGFAFEADGAAVGMAGRLVVDRLADAEAVAGMAVEHPLMAGGRGVAHAFGRAQHGQHRVVEALAALDVIRADDDVVEQACLLRGCWDLRIVGNPGAPRAAVLQARRRRRIDRPTGPIASCRCSRGAWPSGVSTAAMSKWRSNAAMASLISISAR
mmetsp:Transcript_59431/g.140502  ORF Transcript_59431/g.140502 Transcript_59431/m.140502 type:complete len:247 (-) Transcript_59431:211-951(-)